MLLLLDACGTTGTVALADAGPHSTVLASASLPGRTAAEGLIAAIRSLTAHPDRSLQSLTAIAVVSGPGGFTGVRVGISAAKGLCEALALPLIAVSRLAVLTHLAAATPVSTVFALLDAGRGEFYLRTSAPGQPATESLITRDQLIGTLDQHAHAVSGTHPRPVLVLCEPALAESLATLHPQFIPEPTAADALPLVLPRLTARDFDDPATLDANYLRRTPAELFAKPAASQTTTLTR